MVSRRHITLGRAVVVAGGLTITLALALQIGATPAETAGWFALLVAWFAGNAAALWAASAAGGLIALRLKADEPFGRTLGFLTGVLLLFFVWSTIGGIDGD